jgi:hypothetical protein
MLTEVFVHKETSFPQTDAVVKCAVCISGLLKKQNFQDACGKYSPSTDCKDLLPYYSKFAEKLLVPNCKKQCETFLPRTFKVAPAKPTTDSRMVNFFEGLQRNKKNDIGSDVSGAVVFIRSFQDRRSLASFL